MTIDCRVNVLHLYPRIGSLRSLLKALRRAHARGYRHSLVFSTDFREDKQNEVLVTNSSLNEKQMELEQIRGAVKREEHKSEQEGERVMGVCRESGQVMLAINNLHSRSGVFV